EKTGEPRRRGTGARRRPHRLRAKVEQTCENSWISLGNAKNFTKLRLQTVYKAVKICYSVSNEKTQEEIRRGDNACL
ncbi:MAG TPA: hypothetical protein IAA32_00555, partial [Candidatus Butyricicoccus stercorigallinarum]|nr:hypothetical protein [Candidatus Butyricicoccus stercorigallinarum]